MSHAPSDAGSVPNRGVAHRRFEEARCPSQPLDGPFSEAGPSSTISSALSPQCGQRAMRRTLAGGSAVSKRAPHFRQRTVIT